MWISIDEITDTQGWYVANVLIKKLDKEFHACILSGRS